MFLVSKEMLITCLVGWRYHARNHGILPNSRDLQTDAVIEGSALLYTGARPATAPAAPFGTATADRAAARQQRSSIACPSSAPATSAPDPTPLDPTCITSSPCATTAYPFHPTAALGAPRSLAHTSPPAVLATPTTQTGERTSSTGGVPSATCLLTVHKSSRGLRVLNPNVAAISGAPSPCVGCATPARADAEPKQSAQSCSTKQYQPRSLPCCKSKADSGFHKPFGPVLVGRKQHQSCSKEGSQIEQVLEGDQQNLVPCCEDRRCVANCRGSSPRETTAPGGGYNLVWTGNGVTETAPSRSGIQAGRRHERWVRDLRGGPCTSGISATMPNRSREGDNLLPASSSSGTFPNYMREGSARGDARWQRNIGAEERPVDAGGENDKPAGTPLPGSRKEEGRRSRLLWAGQKLRTLQRAPCRNFAMQHCGAPQPCAEIPKPPSEAPAPNQSLTRDFTSSVCGARMRRGSQRRITEETTHNVPGRSEEFAPPLCARGRVPTAGCRPHSHSAPGGLPLDPDRGPPKAAVDRCRQRSPGPADQRYLDANQATAASRSSDGWPCVPMGSNRAESAGNKRAGGQRAKPSHAKLAHVEATTWDVLAAESRLLMDWAGMGGDWLSESLLPAAQALFQSQGPSHTSRSRVS